MVKDITEAQDESMNFNVTEYENVINMISDFTLQESVIGLAQGGIKEKYPPLSERPLK